MRILCQNDLPENSNAWVIQSTNGMTQGLHQLYQHAWERHARLMLTLLCERRLAGVSSFSSLHSAWLFWEACEDLLFWTVCHVGSFALSLSRRKNTCFVFCHQRKQLSDVAVLPERMQNFPNPASVQFLLLRRMNSYQVGKSKVVLAWRYRDPGEKKMVRKFRIHRCDCETSPDRIFSIVLGEVAIDILERLLVPQGKWVEEMFNTKKARVIPSILLKDTRCCNC